MRATDALRIDRTRLMAWLAALAEVGMTADDACCRLALTDADRAGRDLVVQWIRELGLEVKVDAIGNVFGCRAGENNDLAPVMTGSHIDTVRTGGRYDGSYGLLAGLEVVRALNEAGITTHRPLIVAVFTNEEGARFQPDMLGSLVYAGGLSLGAAYALKGIDGAVLRDELARIGYLGNAPLPLVTPHAFVELHIEQGPVLDSEGVTIGAVQDLQGISWQAIHIVGQSNHAGTTPMRLRHDAGYCAAAIGVFLRQLADDMGAGQVTTMGAVTLHPNLVNVIAARATVLVDLRNTDEAALQQAEARLAQFLETLAEREGVAIETEVRARLEPVRFDVDLPKLISRTAERLGHSHRPMTSGAGHDAQMMARLCPTAMIFVPSVDGISHNADEHTEPDDLAAGADVLLHTLLELAA